jgi:hypothetical protein
VPPNLWIVLLLTDVNGHKLHMSKLVLFLVGDVWMQLYGNLDQWPHLKELVQSYKADWLKDERKYGHYECIPPPVFEQQIFEGPDTDVETELRLSTRHVTSEDMDDEEPSTSGRQSSTINSVPARKHLGGPPLPAYEPVFNWVTERAFIFGQRTSELPASLSPSSGLKISVKLVSLNLQAGLVGMFAQQEFNRILHSVLALAWI